MSLQNASPTIRALGNVSLLSDHGVPSVTSDDMHRIAVVDYKIAVAESEKAWIRRAVHAEAFAKALEAELEILRAKLRGE